MFQRIPGNVREDSGECSRRFWGLFHNIPGNVIKDSEECSTRFQWMFKKILGILIFDLFLEILLSFYQILLLNCHKIMEKKQLLSNFSKENIFSITTYNKSSELNYYFSYLAIFFVSFSFLLCWSKRVITLRRNRGIKKL